MKRKKLKPMFTKQELDAIKRKGKDYFIISWNKQKH